MHIHCPQVSAAQVFVFVVFKREEEQALPV